MLVKQEFIVDLVDLKHCPEPESLIKHTMAHAAARLGRELVEHFPYKKDEERSFKGTLPEYVLNREHQYVDHYVQRLVVLTEEQAKEIMSAVRRSNLSHEQIIRIHDLLTT